MPSLTKSEIRGLWILAIIIALILLIVWLCGSHSPLRNNEPTPSPVSVTAIDTLHTENADATYQLQQPNCNAAPDSNLLPPNQRPQIGHNKHKQTIKADASKVKSTTRRPAPHPKAPDGLSPLRRPVPTGR